MHPHGTYGFLDVDLGMPNKVLALPIKEFEGVFDLAFSKDFIKRFYPEGLTE